MPAVRGLAVELGINANTVSRVYHDLQQQGLLRLERGVGTFVDRPRSEPTLADRDYQRIIRRTRNPVALAREAELTTRELCQLVESTWKETET